MKFYFKIYKSAFYLAVEKGNIEIVKLLLLFENLNINYTIV